VHLSAPYSYACGVCHDKTAVDKDTLAVGATDHRSAGSDGQHVDGVQNVVFSATALNATLAGDSYDSQGAGTGTCSVYCHDPSGNGTFADWDTALPLGCADCHEGRVGDGTTISTGSHTRHIADANGPQLACSACHGTNSDAGTHAGHVDGVVDVIPPLDGVNFNSICEECHGYDAEAGEVLPVWGNSGTTDCATCHAGIQCGVSFTTLQGDQTPLDFTWARSAGHNRPTAAGAYPSSGNSAANATCDSCHLTDSPLHWNGTDGDFLLRTDLGFPATYAGSENAFCLNCHDGSTAQTVNTHKGKNCIACHNLHGDGSNIQMIWTSMSDQVSHDASATGKYAADVFFTAIAGADSYDEDDGAAGGAGEINSDDICATCHSVGAGTTHNNSDNSAVTHYQGQDCFTCHGGHGDTDAFKVGVGTACNDCHGFPPATGAHVRHSQSATNDKDVEDRTDCANCHTGADLYTYDLSADILATLNHSNVAGRKTILAGTVGYNATTLDCASACHTSTAGNGGRWTDSTGISCDACHYYSATPSSAGNAGDLSLSHDDHFDKGKLCTDCHTLDDGAIPTAGPLTHIDDISGADQGAMYTGMAQALADEAAVTRVSMTFTDATNTCSGSGIGLGCHASGTPDWDIAIPATGCADCHTDTNTATYNPVSGLHDNSPSGPTVTGNSHDNSFDDGSAGTADCTTCHSTTPSASHIDGTLDTGAAVIVQAIAGYTQGAGTCATTCHSAGTTWAYKWSNSAYNTDGTECANCHGDYASGWNTGVAPHTENPTRGSKHNSTGTLTYPCTDCHAIGSVSGYNWTSKWDPTGVTSNHGDDKITMNQTAINTFAIDTTPNPDRAGCTTASCHANDAAHTLRVTATVLPPQTVTGNAPSIACSSCHGGYVGTNANGYWPDGTLDEDTAGAHQKHITVLASEVYSESLTQLLTDNTVGNPGLTSDDKQKELCSYCHNTPGADGDHGIVANLPAEVNGMYTMWTKAADNGAYSAVADTCATVDCHFNKTTPDNTYGWYDGSTSSCVMCHVDVTDDTAHTAHTGAAATFGRTVGCADCHDAATNWGTNTPPAGGHLNNSYAISGSVAFTYSANSCATNDCHNDGAGGIPADNTYTWGSTLANCTICHAATPATGAHAVHVANSTYVANSCDDCHAAATAATHIDASVTYAAEISAAPGNGSCTNTCHIAGDVGDWTGGTSALACTDCHAGSGGTAYIGGDKSGVAGPNNMPQFAMHTVTPTVTGKVHTAAGLSTTCTACHDSMPAPGGTHVNGTFLPDGGATPNTDRGMFASFTDGATPTCATACHSAGTSWTYQWSATAANSDGTECANCHGDYANGWNAGVGHAVNPGRGNSSNHDDIGTLSYQCTACHVIGATTGNYPWSSGGNDWASEGSTLHGDGNIQMNSNTAVHTRSGTAGCSGCHAANDGTHDFPISAWTPVTVAGDTPAAGGGCSGCHNSGTDPDYPDEIWPGHTGSYPSRGGKHKEHVAAIAAAMPGGNTSGNRNNSCNYCHVNPGEPGHNDNISPSADFSIRHILDQGQVDSDPIVNGGGTAYVTCSTIDCHFNNARTPHWYTDDIAPALVTLTAVPGPNPRSIKVSWNAPGDDNNVADTTPYVYDMRYGTSAATATNFGLTDNYAGNLPAAYTQGYASEAVIENLNVGTTYYFSLKSSDVAGNWSPASAAVSAQPTADAVAPDFGGADKAVKGDEGGTINLYWTAAEDHTMPITYKIWLKDEAVGTLDMDVDSPSMTGWTDTRIELNGAHGVVDDHIYHMGVRACDALNNCDTNTQTVSATPTAPPTVDKTYHTYVTSGSTTLVKDGTPGTAVNAQALPQTFTPGSNLGFSVIYYIDTFAVYLTNTSATTPTNITATIGYSTNGTNFTALSGTALRAPLSKSVSVPKKSGRVYQFKFADVAGRQFNNGERLAIQLTGNTATCGFGSTGNRGDVTVAERIVNLPPTAATDNGTSLTGAIVDIRWNASTDGTDGVITDVVHYDLYGSNNGGTSYDYVIAEGLDDTHTSWLWDTQTAGISSGSLAVRINAGDSYAHTTTNLTGLGSADANDYVAPAVIDDLVAQARPKSGSVWLKWTAPGDDYGNHGRAAYYDIRYSTAVITEGNFASASQATNEPTPDFGGNIQTFEVTGLIPGTPYYFAIKTYDEADNGSLISTAKAAGSDQALGGPRCGMCHTTAPSVVESVGNHKLHGFTINNCTNCHGAAVSGYTLAHQDGELVMGFAPGGPNAGIISGSRIYYTDDGTPGGTLLYDDTDGFGGFGSGNYTSVGDGVDNGSCFNFGNLGVGGCHGPAGTDPDGGGPLPTYATPNWNAAATLDCAQCHGNPNRTTDTFYGRDFDGTIANGSVVPDQILGAPLVDNHGNYDPAATTEAERKYIGQHEKHLNYSFRFAKGDSCTLCHAGDYADRNALDGRHANGEVDVQLDTSAAGDNATWTPGTAATASTCSNMSPDSCHPSAATPSWDSAQSFDCVGCHTMGGTTPSHVTDPAQSIDLADNDPQTGDPMQGNCTWCHFGGHPRDDVGGTALILDNSSQVGINYRSDGIHLRKTIGSRGPYNTEAELCWGCHDANGISEWGADNSIGGGAANNIAKTVPANASNYNYGQIYTSVTYATPTSNWTAGYWKSAVTNFDYKKGAIQSTHTTSETANAANANNLVAPVGSPLAGTEYNYTEAPDAVSLIRCSNCHDVHNLNKAPGDNPDADPALDGPPYLRGTWVRNPYPEDGAPWNKSYGTVVSTFANVPRAGGNEPGGYQIDQNNNSPTAGLSAATSAGLCLLCHGSDGIDAMDRTVESNLWVGSNGHSNATLGGTASAAANIFGNGIGGRDIPDNTTSLDESFDATDLYDMALQNFGSQMTVSDYGVGYRGTQYDQGAYEPGIYRPHAYKDYQWGATVDQATTDVGYHAFTCSKCHNPHASRLPKLMITNCLDTSHSTWDTGSNGGNGQTMIAWTAGKDRNELTSTWNTAQNCHRVDSRGNANAGGYLGGWNKVTPW
jgi:hypothetical protein